MSSKHARGPQIDFSELADDQLTEEYLQDIVPKIPEEPIFTSCIVADNLPIVPESKFGKLYQIIENVFKNIGPIREGGLYMPKDPVTKATYGFAFIEFVEPHHATLARQRIDGGKFDAKHTFAVNDYDDLDKYKSIPEEYVPPQLKDDDKQVFSWLLEPEHLNGDQFIIRYDNESEIYWNDPEKKADLIYKKKNWTESFVSWSPKGTYLTTFHSKGFSGIMIWGGKQWQQIAKLEHVGAKLIDYSPQERYIVTFNPEGSPKEDQLFLWDIKTGEKIKTFSIPHTAREAQAWPILKWSHDDKYLARIEKGGIQVFELASLKSFVIPLPNVKDFCWSPSQHLVCCWIPAADASASTPARMVLLDVATRKEKRTKNLFGVTDCKMHWQSKGDYVCVKVERIQKKKKTTYFELFRTREKGVPIEVLELNQNIVAFAWEPNGHRFAISHIEDNAPAVQRPDISFYTMKGNKLKLLTTLEKRPASHLFWSPRGRHIVLAGFRSNLNGALEFYDVDELTTLGTSDHFMATELDWDPTGRFVATGASAWRHQLENGYYIWTFQGRLLQKVLKDRFYQFLWRPRPPTLLSEEKETDITKNINKIAKTYIEQDKQIRKKAENEKKKARDALRNAFNQFLVQKRDKYVKDKALRRQIRGRDSDDDADYEFVFKDVDEVVEQYEEPILDEDLL